MTHLLQSPRMLITEGNEAQVALYRAGQWVELESGRVMRVAGICWETSQPVFSDSSNCFTGQWTEPGFFYKVQAIDEFDYPSCLEVAEELIVRAVNPERSRILDSAWRKLIVASSRV